MTPATKGRREYDLGDLFDFANGINADKSAYGSGTPFVNVLEVITKESLTEEDIPGRVTLPPKVLARYRVNHGDVLLNRTSETQEEVGLASVYLGDQTIVFGGFVFRGQPKTSDLDINYAKYALRAAEVRNQIIACSQGGIRANIGQRDLKKIMVHLPKLPEQRAIAEALDDASALVSVLDKVIAKKRLVKQGLSQELLTGRTRLPGFTGDWVSSTVGAVVKIVGGGTPARNVGAYWGGPIPWATIKDISTFNPISTQEFITPVAVRASATRVVHAGTPVLAVRMLVGKAVRFQVDVAINQDLKALLTGADVDDSYLCHWFDASGRLLASSAGGSTVAGTSTAQIRAMSISLPPVDEQRAIATVLNDATSEIATLERRLEVARAIKEGMMQELLTGRTRLVPLESLP